VPAALSTLLLAAELGVEDGAGLAAGDAGGLSTAFGLAVLRASSSPARKAIPISRMTTTSTKAMIRRRWAPLAPGGADPGGGVAGGDDPGSGVPGAGETSPGASAVMLAPAWR
jgi:hypothetical protein